MCGASEGIQEIQYYSNDEENFPTGEGEGNTNFCIALQVILCILIPTFRMLCHSCLNMSGTKGDMALGPFQCFIPVSLAVTCILHFLSSSLQYF